MPVFKRKRTYILAGGCVLLAGFGALGGCETAATVGLNLITTTSFEVEGEMLFMTGEINSKTLQQFEAVIAEHPQITTLVECNVPGSLDDDTMIPLTYRVRELGLNTYLTSKSVVASGGSDLFLGGVSRQAEAGAQIGVHSWSDGVRDAVDYPRDSPEHAANLGLIEDLLGDGAFYWFTIEAAPAAEIHWMTGDEMEEFGVLTTPVRQPGSGPRCPAEWVDDG